MFVLTLMFVFIFIDAYDNSSHLLSPKCTLGDQIAFYNKNHGPINPEWHNKGDYFHVSRLSKKLATLPMSDIPTIITIGLNKGDLLRLLVSSRNRSIGVHGFEIDKNYVDALKTQYIDFPNIKLHNVGVSNSTSRARVAGKGELMGLYDEEEVFFCKMYVYILL